MDRLNKVISILIVISIIAVALMIIFLFAFDDGGPIWLTYVLIPFTIPLIGKAFSLAINGNKIQPKTWLIIYGIAVVAYFVLLFLVVLT